MSSPDCCPHWRAAELLLQSWERNPRVSNWGSVQEQHVPTAALPQVCLSTPSKLGPVGFSCQLLQLDYHITNLLWVDLIPFWVLSILPHRVPKMQWKNTKKSTFVYLFWLSNHFITCPTVLPSSVFPHDRWLCGLLSDPTGLCLFPKLKNLLCFILGLVSLSAHVCRYCWSHKQCSPSVHLIEADATAPKLKPCSQSIIDIVENILTFSAFSSAVSKWGQWVVTLWSPPPWHEWPAHKNLRTTTLD